MNWKAIRAWIPAFLWIAVIGMESFVGSTDNTAPLVRKFLEFFLGPLKPNTFYLAHAFIRKGGHFFGYGIQSFTLYRAWWVTLRANSHPDRLGWRDMLHEWSGRATLLALLGTFAVAGLDEWHQSFDRTRTGHFGDVVLDEMGGWLAQIVILLSSLGPRRRRQAVPSLTKEAVPTA